MRALEFITGHMVYNLAYTLIVQTITTKAISVNNGNGQLLILEAQLAIQIVNEKFHLP